MSYEESLGRLKNFQKRPCRAVTKVPKPPFVTFGTSLRGHSVKTATPSVTFGTASTPLSRKSQDTQHTPDALHTALTRAVESLPITVADLIKAFGEEGASDWVEGYTPHCRPEFLRAFAIAVSERLERERGDSQEHPPGGAVTKAPDPGPLDDLPLLREDREFIEARTLYRRDRDSLLIEYVERWREAAAAKFVPHRRANAGRRAANAWLREATR